MTTPSPAPQWADDLTASISKVIWMTGARGEEYHLAVKAVRELILESTTKHAAALSEENERLKRERDEAIKAHGFVWNAARKAAQYFRWAGCRDTIAIEAMNQCCEAEKLTPKWSTDWVIVTPLELTTLRQWSEQAREAMEGAATAMDALIILGEQNVPAPYAPLKERFARDRLKALLQSHPAATNLTEEGKNL